MKTIDVPKVEEPSESDDLNEQTIAAIKELECQKTKASLNKYQNLNDMHEGLGVRL